VFIPESSQGSFQSLDISSACLAVSKRLRIGSGVIRILEHEPTALANRLLTLQELSDNRFILGIGTGRPSSNPKQTIQSLLERLHSTRESFRKFGEPMPHLRMPETIIATLRRGIAKAVTGHSDGILLNFCPPAHVRDLVSSLDRSSGKLPTVLCYLKLFYSRNEDTARAMLVGEFASYNRNQNYHEMFESAGVADDIASASSALGSNRDVHLSEKLRQISLANPTGKELADYVGRFRDAGVDVPCLYPYFEYNEEEAFKMSKVGEIVQI